MPELIDFIVEDFIGLFFCVCLLLSRVVSMKRRRFFYGPENVSDDDSSCFLPAAKPAGYGTQRVLVVIVEAKLDFWYLQSSKRTLASLFGFI